MGVVDDLSSELSLLKDSFVDLGVQKAGLKVRLVAALTENQSLKDGLKKATEELEKLKKKDAKK